jgi:hypothetical protein
MIPLSGIAWFFGGVFLANSVPHLVNGVSGKTFQTPFARPRGQGKSSAVVNVIWGTTNLVIAYALLDKLGSFDPHATVDMAVCGLGALLIALFSAHWFGRFNGDKTSEEPH